MASRSESDDFILPDVVSEALIKTEPKEDSIMSPKAESVLGLPCSDDLASVTRNPEHPEIDSCAVIIDQELETVPLEMVLEDPDTISTQDSGEILKVAPSLMEDEEKANTSVDPKTIATDGEIKIVDDGYKSTNIGVLGNLSESINKGKDLTMCQIMEKLNYISNVENSNLKSPNTVQTDLHDNKNIENVEDLGKQHHTLEQVQINKCFQCKMVFPELRDLENHIKMHLVENDVHVAGGQYPQYDHRLLLNSEMSLKGPQSEQSFASLAELEAHVGMNTISNEKNYSCNQCDKAFVKKFELTQHMKSHAEEKPLPYKCSYCEKTFSKQWFLNRHLPLHVQGKPFECDQCDRVFRHKCHLTKHLRTHVGESSLEGKAHKCHLCGKEFLKRYHFNRHVLSHTGEKPHKCDHCEKAFSDKYLLKEHVRLHTCETVYKCSQCVKAFPEKAELDAHSIVHTEDTPHRCMHCGKTFALKCYLNKHILLHLQPLDDNLKKPSHKCHLCEKTFCKKFHLIRHVQLHSGEKPHICHHCGRAFSQKSNLTTHILSHLGEKPYKCNHCGSVFSHKCNLIRHVKLHGIDPREVSTSTRNTVEMHIPGIPIE